MPVMTEAQEAAGRLQRYLGFLEGDPENTSLMLDAAETAFAAGEPQLALSLARQLQDKGQVPAGFLGRLGFAAMSAGEFAAAASLYGQVLAMGGGGSAVRYNLAYAEAKAGRFDAALVLLGPEVTRELPQAATLEVQLLHQQGEFQMAFETAKAHLGAFPDDSGLLAAASTLALDNEDVAFARDCARRAGDQPDALTSLGTISLGEAAPDAALDLFRRALALNDTAPRSWIGLGLARLALGETAAAAADIDRGAELFSDHIGSWLAAGWARLLQGDLQGAVQRFERARQIDPAFAETIGSLAVVDAIQGRQDEARRKSAAALRLDRESFTALYAQSLIQAGAGNDGNARRIFDALTETPVGTGGLTMQDMMSKMVRGRR
jgi:tetratricopeptide (TPR) repeat protein